MADSGRMWQAGAEGLRDEAWEVLGTSWRGPGAANVCGSFGEELGAQPLLPGHPPAALRVCVAAGWVEGVANARELGIIM